MTEFGTATGAAVIEPPWGEVIVGPLYDQEGIVFADCDLRRGLHAKRLFDAVGHYSRANDSLSEPYPGAQFVVRVRPSNDPPGR
jgi:hypothetical protein